MIAEPDPRLGKPMTLVQALETLFEMLRRRQRFILTLFLVLFALAATLILVVPEKFLADSMVLVRFGREHALQSYGEGDRPTPVNYDQEQIINSAVEIMGARVLAERTVRQIGYMRIYPRLCDSGLSDRLMAWLGRPNPRTCEDPVREASERLREEVKISPLGRSSVIRAEFAHRDPTVAYQVLNRYIADFQAIYKPLYLEDPVSSLQAEVARSRQDLALANKKVVDFESSTFAFEDDGQVERLLLRKTQLQQQISRLEACCLDTSAVQGAVREIAAIDADIVRNNVEQATLKVLVRERQAADQQLTDAINRLRDAQNMQDLERSGVSGVQVVSRAELPVKSVQPGMPVRLVLAAAFAMVGSVATALVLELLRRRFSTPDEIEAAFGLPVLANIPFRTDRLS